MISPIIFKGLSNDIKLDTPFCYFPELLPLLPEKEDRESSLLLIKKSFKITEKIMFNLFYWKIITSDISIFKRVFFVDYCSICDKKKIWRIDQISIHFLNHISKNRDSYLKFQSCLPPNPFREKRGRELWQLWLA